MANNNNIFRQAKQLLNQKPVLEMTTEELGIVNTATMPLLLLREFSDRSIDEGLEELSKIVDEAYKDGSGGRGVEQGSARQGHNLKVAGSNPAPATNVN